MVAGERRLPFESIPVLFVDDFFLECFPGEVDELELFGYGEICPYVVLKGVEFADHEEVSAGFLFVELLQLQLVLQTAVEVFELSQDVHVLLDFAERCAAVEDADSAEVGGLYRVLDIQHARPVQPQADQAQTVQRDVALKR